MLFNKVIDYLNTPTKKVYFFSMVTGMIVGLVAIVFTYLLAILEYLFLSHWMGIELSHPKYEYALKVMPNFLFWIKNFTLPNDYKRYLIFILPGLGAFIGALIIGSKWHKEASGSGTESVIRAFHEHEGKIPYRIPFIKTLSTLFTLGAGGAGGKEGPMSLIGGSIGSFISDKLGMGTRARRTFLLAGAAAGLGAIFRAPLGGAFTAIEVIYKEDFESDALIPCIISSVTGYITYCYAYGFNYSFNVLHSATYQSLGNLFELGIYLILAIVCVVVGNLYTLFFGFIKNRVFNQYLSIPFIYKPLIGGLVIGILGFFYPEALGSGFGIIQNILNGNLEINLIALGGERYFAILKIVGLLLIVRIVSASFTVGSGGSGGILVPSLVIGGLLGTALGATCNWLFPYQNISMISYCIVGMAGFFAGVASAPIASFVMVCEITGAYQLIPPLMLVSVITIIFLPKNTLYRYQAHNRFVSPAHAWDMQIDVLKHRTVKELLSKDAKQNKTVKKDFLSFLKKHPYIVSEQTSLQQLQDITAKHHYSYFIVINQDRHPTGHLSINNIPQEELLAPDSNNKLVRDVMETNVKTVTFEDNLSEAVENILHNQANLIAVIDGNQLVDVLMQKTILKLYLDTIKHRTNVSSHKK